ncbi:MFS transporter [Mesorhizobium sp. LNJC398B00]|uniref:MFS transporter n=1 Tax=Mesorhizobium sp. LNJC398B00 TaxID=1287276 RepID=UPI0003FF37BE
MRPKEHIVPRGRLGGTSWLSPQQEKTVLASFLGWTLDAFDFFLLTFLLTDIATDFNTDVPAVSKALFLTLATRFIGAFFFGRLADKYGRKPILMLNIVSYSVIGALAAFSPNLGIFLALRALFGIAMGGEWGLGSSLAMESIPPSARGMVSGILQCGYPTGYLLAAVVYGVLYQQTIGGYTIGWRAMFLLSFLPALIVLFIRSHVPESPAFVEAQKSVRPGLLETLQKHWGVAVYAVVLMMFFNFFSHGTQDLYPTFLKKQHGFDPHTVSWITIVANIGAIVGGLAFGALSEKIGRVNAITLACLIALPSIPLWAFSSTPFMLAIGAFVMQVAVQGAWGVIPVHLNELSPGAVRATLPGFIYQAGNLAASYGGPYQAGIAEASGGSYGYALALFAGVVAVCIILVIRFSPERRGQVMTVLG